MAKRCGEKDSSKKIWQITGSNENLEDESGWTPKDRKTEIEVE